MWPFLDNQKQSKSQANDTNLEDKARPRPMKFSQIVDGMGDFSDLANHNIAMKFWLPEMLWMPPCPRARN